MNQVEENENEQGETLNFDQPDYAFVPKGNHEWRQQGPYLCCKSCELSHAVWIGVEKQMVGIDKKGQPILKKVGKGG